MCCHSSVQHSAADSIAVVAVADNIVVDIAVEPAPAAVNSHMPAVSAVSAVSVVSVVSVAALNTVPARLVPRTAVPHTAVQAVPHIVVQAVPAVRHWRLPMHRCMQSKHLHCHHNTNYNLDIFS